MGVDTMPTKIRLWYEGASYHVTTRGNNKSNIFKEAQDFEKYLSIIYEAMEYYNYNQYELICYCLMTNHVHLMIKTSDKPLADLMGRINARYTRYFNKKYDCIGHLFQGRYFSDIVRDHTQLLEISRYIHLNPVKAKIVSKPCEYKWSSYNIITKTTPTTEDKVNTNTDLELNLELDLDLVNTNIILDYFNKETRYNSYIDYVEEKSIV